MRRHALIASVLLLAACGAATATAKRAPVAIGVAEREFHITTYRSAVRPGPVRFNLTNFGEDAHDLQVRGPGGFRAQGPDVESGDRATFTATLRRPGTYVLLCTRANHARLGMRAKLKVRR